MLKGKITAAVSAILLIPLLIFSPAAVSGERSDDAIIIDSYMSFTCAGHPVGNGYMKIAYHESRNIDEGFSDHLQNFMIIEDSNHHVNTAKPQNATSIWLTGGDVFSDNGTFNLYGFVLEDGVCQVGYTPIKISGFCPLASQSYPIGNFTLSGPEIGGKPIVLNQWPLLIACTFFPGSD